MKLENLKVGAIIMHADAKTNPIHTGTMYIVLKINKKREDIEACCVNCKLDTAIGEVRHISTRSISEYNMLFQICIAPPADPSKGLYLRWAFGRNTSLGKIGEKTPYRLESGRNLFVGDIVKISREGDEHSGCLVAHDSVDGYFIMGIALDCNDTTGEIAGWNVTLESAFCNRFEGDTFNLEFDRPQIEVVDCPPEEK